MTSPRHRILVASGCSSDIDRWDQTEEQAISEESVIGFVKRDKKTRLEKVVNNVLGQ